MPSVICTCSYCRNCKITINGIQQPGKKVSAATRQDHEKRDKQRPSSQKPSPAFTSASEIPDPPKGVK